MIANVDPYLEKVQGNTYCIVTGYSRIPIYLADRDRAVLLDSGLAVYQEGILALLKKEKIRIGAILTSHAHIDHTGNHHQLQKIYGAQVYMSLFNAAVSKSPMNLKSHLYGTSYRGTISYGRSMICRADHVLDYDEKGVHACGADFEILKLPGHSPEHMGFVTPDGVAYLADALMSESVLNSVRIPYSSCVELELQTKEAIKEMHYDTYIIAHNSVCTEVAALSEMNKQHLLEKIAVIAGLADHYLSLEQLVAQAAAQMGVSGSTVYKVNVAMRNIEIFVEHLLDSGVLTCRANQGIIEYIRRDCI